MPILTHDQMYNKMGVPSFGPLIIEFAQQRVDRDNRKCIFTLKDQKEGYISLKRIFIDYTVDDPSEASFADAVFGDVGYWLRVRDQKELAVTIAKWRLEADVIRKSHAFKAMVSEVKENGKSSFSAAKYLIEEPWKGKTKAVKSEVKKTAEEAYGTVSEDKKRLQEAGLLN